jgi:hypothetical protein
MPTKLLSENLKGTDYSEDLGGDGRIILKWMPGIQGGCAGLCSVEFIGWLVG